MSFRGPPKSLLLYVTVLALSSACNSKDAAKCEDAVKVTRQALNSANTALTQQWREYAYKNCADDGTLASLDKEIIEKQAAQKAKSDEEAVRKQQNDGIIKTYLNWVGENRGSPERASATPVCEGDTTAAVPAPAAKAKERFCTATRTAGTTTLTARYWDADKAAVLFTVRPPGPVACTDLGPNRVLQTWDVPAAGGTTAKRTRCELTSGPLSGMHAVVSAAVRADVYIFSPQYLDRDAALKPILSAP